MKPFSQYLAEAEKKHKHEVAERNSNDPVAVDSASPISGNTVTSKIMYDLLNRPSHKDKTRFTREK